MFKPPRPRYSTYQIVNRITSTPRQYHQGKNPQRQQDRAQNITAGAIANPLVGQRWERCRRRHGGRRRGGGQERVGRWTGRRGIRAAFRRGLERRRRQGRERRRRWHGRNRRQHRLAELAHPDDRAALHRRLAQIRPTRSRGNRLRPRYVRHVRARETRLRSPSQVPCAKPAAIRAGTPCERSIRTIALA